MRSGLIIHHVLPKFRLDDDHIENFDPKTYIPAILSWIERFQPEPVIMTKCEDSDDIYPELAEVCGQVELWSWITDDDADEEEIANRWTVPVDDVHRTYALGREHFSLLRPWMRDLLGDRVMVVGGDRDECIFGLCDAFDKLGIEHEVHCDLVFPFPGK